MGLDVSPQYAVRPSTRGGTAQPLLQMPPVCIWMMCMVRDVADEVLLEGDSRGVAFGIGGGGRPVGVRVGGFVLGDGFQGVLGNGAGVGYCHRNSSLVSCLWWFGT